MEAGMISLKGLEYWLNQGLAMQLIDLRMPDDYRAAHIAGAVNIPYNQLAERIGELKADPPLVFYCARGGTSLRAARMAADKGLPAFSVMGGITYYRGCHMIRN